MVERTGTGDPRKVVPLLWGQDRTVGRRGLSLERIVEAGVALADEQGIRQVSMRRIADRLGVGAMSLYAHVPGKGELLDLMVDAVHGEVRYGADGTGDSVQTGGDDGTESTAGLEGKPWRAALEQVAQANWDLLERHPWLLDVDTTRSPLGPGTIAKYDVELGALEETGLDDVATDQALALVLEHVRSSARQAFAAEADAAGATGSDGGSAGEWWEASGPLLASLMDPSAYPRASRIGEAAGQEYDAPTDPRRAYAFGLQVILAGLGDLIRAG